MSAVAVAGERAYYITAYTDEVMPCEPSLAGWAEWLSKPNAEWGRDEPMADGAMFDASVLRFEPDIMATRTGDGWSFSRDPAGADFLAVRYGEGLGWDAESIVDDLREWLTENGEYCEDQEFVAVGMNEPDVRLTYRAGPPPSMSAEVVQ